MVVVVEVVVVEVVVVVVVVVVVGVTALVAVQATVCPSPGVAVAVPSAQSRVTGSNPATGVSDTV